MLRRVAGRLTGAWAAWSVWALLRAYGVAMLAGLYPSIDGDVHLYGQWAARFHGGAIPFRDFHIEYPPGILPVIALPGTGISYVRVFFIAAFAADAVSFLLLRRRGGEIGQLVWLASPILLGPVFWARLDIFVALALVGAVVAIERRHVAVAGACIGYAALLKLWPVALGLALLPSLRRADRFRLASAFGLIIAAFLLPVLALGGGNGLMWMLRYHGSRGVEVEAVLAVPLHYAAAFGAAIHVVTAHGCDEFAAYAKPLSIASTLAMLVAAVGCVLLARSRVGRSVSPAQLLFVLCTLVLVTSKVLSPQYMAWLIAGAALMVDEVPHERRPLLVAWLALSLMASEYLYPFAFDQLVQPTPVGVALVTAHAAALLALTVSGLRTILGSCRQRRPIAASVAPIPALLATV